MNTSTILLALDAAINTQGRRCRTRALDACAETMRAAKIPASSHLWEKLHDAYDADFPG